MKPESYKDCPDSVLEALLWDMDLDYDSYEGSKEEVIHHVLCGASISSVNEKIISTGWKMLSEERFRERCQQALGDLERQVSRLKVVLGFPEETV
jgi:hypothetical protein